MKIAFIFSGNTNLRTGKFNHVLERAKAINKHKGVDVHVFLIQKTYSHSFRMFKNIEVTFEDYTEIGEVKIKNLWVNKTLWEYLATHKLKLKDVACKKQLNKYTSLFQEYDLLSTNGLLESHLASIVKAKYNVPFVNTWHGSDINVYPYRSKKSFKLINQLLNLADYNFFVSKTLLNKSNEIADNNKKDYLYIGPGNQFYRLSDNQIKKLRYKYKIKTKNVVGFVGNMVSVKNVLVLPDIFKSVQKEIQDITFVLVGDGSLLGTVKNKISEYNIRDIIYTGLVEPEEIPDIMNLFDVLVLPSKNEGLPLVTLEAQKCGVHVVGSNVGGIPETVKEENIFALENDFILNISNRIIEIIKTNEIPRPLPEEFSLDSAIQKELNIYKELSRTR